MKKVGWNWSVTVLFAVGAYVIPAQAESYPCMIEPMEMAALATPVSGVLRQVMVKRGDRVQKGQLLAVLDLREEKAAAALALYKSNQKGPVREAQAKIVFAQRKFDRLHKMAKEHLVPEQKLDDAEAELRQAQAELLTAQENLRIAHLDYEREQSRIARRSIYSPFDGVVESQSVWPGDVVQPSDSKHPVLKVARLDPLNVRAILPMSEFGKPEVGMRATLIPELASFSQLEATVSSVDRMIDAASGSFEISLSLPNPHFEVPAGVKCQVAFTATNPRQERTQSVSAVTIKEKAQGASQPFNGD